MSDKKRVRRRRSIRLSRQSLLPSVSDTECVDAADNDAFANQGALSTTASVYNIAQTLDTTCGSAWVDEEISEKVIKKKRSRRSNIGFHVVKSHEDEDTEDGENDNLNEDRLKKIVSESVLDFPDIEIPRRPCPDAMSVENSPDLLCDGPGKFDISKSHTPNVIQDSSLPYLHTPSSANISQKNLLESNQAFEDVFMLDRETPTSGLESNCPPSCEDESDDSLLVGTPDLTKFKKNIRFKCNLNFTDLDQTPTKADDNPGDSSKDSIHESPIVGYVYDKLSASDVVRRRRSSYRGENLTLESSGKKKRSVPPKRLLSCESDIVGSSPTVFESCAKENIPKAVNVSIRSGASSRGRTLSSTPGLYTSCIEEDDFQSLPNTPLPSQCAESPIPNTPLAQSSSNSSTETPRRSKANPSSMDHSTTKLTSASEEQAQMDNDNVQAPEISSDVQSASSLASKTPAKQQDDLAASSELKDYDSCCESTVEPVLDANSILQDCQGSAQKHKIDDTPSKQKSRSKERNIASDVCEVFRSLARRFSSGGGKWKTKRAGSLKNGSKIRLADNGDVSPLFEIRDSSSADVEENTAFTFRKEPNLTIKQNEVSSPSLATTPDKRHSLDFSPFLAKENDTEPSSPVWKLQSEQPKSTNNCESVTLDTCDAPPSYPADMANENTLLTENVLTEETNPIENEVEEKPVKPKRGRPKRRSIEASILQQELLQFQATEQLPIEEEEETEGPRRSRRSSRRNSLEMFRSKNLNDQPMDSPETDSSDSGTDAKPKKPRRKKVTQAVPEENLEDLYRNKNYTLPTERMWETLFESPEKMKQPNVMQSRRKYRRTISFDTLPQSKIRKRLQRAVTQGWDVTGKKRKQIPLEDVKAKMAVLASELGSP